MNNVDEVEVAHLERDIKKYKETSDKYNSLMRLQNNKDFKKLFLEGYFEKEAIRLVHLKADPLFATPERQAAVLRDMDAIGSLRSYLDLIEREGAIAAKQLSDSEGLLEAILTEGE